MSLTKTFLAAAAIAGALLASPPAAASQRRLEPPSPAPRARHWTCAAVPHAPPCQLAAFERPGLKDATAPTRFKR
jgi:hypothetical protein